MCTYHGIIEEYPLISIDSFESHNYTSTMFFISHVHMDHLIGLERPEFGKYVAKINAPIYMSEISKSFLSTMTLYRHLVPYFKSVPLEQAFPLKIQSIDPVQAKKKDGGDMETLKTTLCSHTPNVDETILVTCFGSGHCPGSIMILIEGEHGTVLFTGDYRFYHGQTKRLTHLYRNGIDDARFLMKTIDNLYIDMTFFRPEILHIPTREFSCEVLIEWVKKEIKSNPSVQFYFRASARVGYEQIYRSLFEHLGMRVHVEQSQYDFFSCLPIIQECLTVDPSSTCFHACRSAGSNSSRACSLFRCSEKPIRIHLSIMWFTEQVAASEVLVEFHEYHSNFDQSSHRSSSNSMETFRNYRLCYSLHSSFSEIGDFLQTVRPRRTTPIAAPLPTLLTRKNLFRFIEFFTELDSNRNIVMASSKILFDLTRRKNVADKIQLKHRYESFETQIERKRRKKYFLRAEKRRINGEQLDFLDEQNDESNIPFSSRRKSTKSIDEEFHPENQSFIVLSIERDPIDD